MFAVSSVIAFDALARFSCRGTGVAAFATRSTEPGEEFVKPDSIIKTSVGEYYINNMNFFIRVANDVQDYLLNVWLENPDSSPRSLVDYISDALRPLGFSTTLPNQNRSAALDINETLRLLASPVKDPVLFNHVLDLFAIKMERGSVLEGQLAYVQACQREIEQLSQSICVGYAPKRDVGRMTVLRQDSGFINENIIANIVYPWGMQPMNQLRALIPSLDPEIVDRIIKSAICPAAFYPDYFPALNTGSAFAYEFITDFRAYLDFRCARNQYPVNIQRQFWTPFFGVYDHQMFAHYIKDSKLLSDIDQCFLRSKKLYIEMLKTGLGYLSQYAVLMGMAGRWMVSGNLAGVLETVSNMNTINYGHTAFDIAKDMIADLKNNKVAAEFFKAQCAGNKNEKE